ncbi:MAG: PEP-CTERM sorting domain-containing protein [Planctomycetota bacterium]
MLRLPSSLALAFSLLLIGGNVNADLIVWTGASNGSFSNANNWRNSDMGDIPGAPQSGVDSVLFGDSATGANLNSTFIVGAGQSFSANLNNYVFRLSTNGDLTIATGGTLDFSNAIFAEAPGGSNMNLTIEPGATVTTGAYFDEINYTTTFLADSSGVSTFNVAGNFFLRGGTLNIDVTNYDDANGDLILFDYGNSIGGVGAYSTVNIIGGSGTIDYAHDLGGGDLAIALTNVSAIPEPGSMSLFAAGLAGVFVRRRRA